MEHLFEEPCPLYEEEDEEKLTTYKRELRIMKVGMIGLGRMGEGMSRRMIKAGIEVHGYRNNVQKS